MLLNISKYHEAQGHGNFNKRDSKSLSKVCFDCDAVERCQDNECEISGDAKNGKHYSTLEDNYLLKRRIIRNKIPENVKNIKHLKQIGKGNPRYMARSPEKENNSLPTKRANVKASQVSH